MESSDAPRRKRESGSPYCFAGATSLASIARDALDWRSGLAHTNFPSNGPKAVPLPFRPKSHSYSSTTTKKKEIWRSQLIERMKLSGFPAT